MIDYYKYVFSKVETGELSKQQAKEIAVQLQTNEVVHSVAKLDLDTAQIETLCQAHQVAGQHILPGVTYFHIVYNQLRQVFAPFYTQPCRVSFKNTIWLQPLVYQVQTQVELVFDILNSHKLRFVFRCIDTPEHKVLCEGEVELQAPSSDATGNTMSEQSFSAINSFNKAEFYRDFERKGIIYGPLLQGVEEATVQGKKSYAKITVNEPYGKALSPILLDCALQSIALLYKMEPGSSQTWVPFSVDELVIYDDSPLHEAIVVSEFATLTNGRARKVNINILSAHGQLHMSLSGLNIRAIKSAIHTPNLNEAGAQMVGFAPIWQKRPVVAHDSQLLHSEAVFITSSNDDLSTTQQQGTLYVQLDDENMLASLRNIIRERTQISHFVYALTPASQQDGQELITEHHRNITQLFSVVKLLISEIGNKRGVKFSLFTRNAQTFADSAVDYSQSSLTGLMGTLANEYPHWHITMLDIGLEDKLRDILPIVQSDQLPSGEQHILRDGTLYHSRLLPIENFNISQDTEKSEEQLYRQNGIYVVIGGSGGLGQAWTRHLISHFGAKVIWLGRTEKNAQIQAKISACESFDNCPEYLSVDASEPGALTEAFDYIEAQYGALHGVVNAAMTLNDQSLSAMTEAQLLNTLHSKVDVSVWLGQAIAARDLDFVLLFSSMLSFSKSPGQANYASASCFMDAYAQHLRRMVSYPVKVINWGFWGYEGAVATDSYRQRMASVGVASIESSEAMPALAWLGSHSIEQVAAIKLYKSPAEFLAHKYTNECLTVQKQPVRKNIAQTIPISISGSPPEAEYLSSQVEVNILINNLLLSLIYSVSEHFDEGPIFSRTQLCNALQCLGIYTKWLDASLNLLLQHGKIKQRHINGSEHYCMTDECAIAPCGELLLQWRQQHSELMKQDSVRLQIDMLTAVFTQINQILSCQLSPMDVLFPAGQMDNLQAIYKDNPVSAFCNRAVAEVVAKRVDALTLNAEYGEIRILEVGAGSGATTEQVLALLEPYQDHIKEYCFSDISQAFLQHGKQLFAARYPFVQYKHYDVTKPLNLQAMNVAQYDIVIATNVLHATSEIHQTLINLNASLKHRGMLVINELIENKPFAHVTFGLLPGWWQFADAEVRMSGGPLLSKNMWHHVLSVSGFEHISWPLSDVTNVGQEVFVGYSNGLAVVPQKQAHHIPIEQAEESVMIISDHSENATLAARVIEYLTNKVSDVLNIPAQKINANKPLEQYGIDSILVVRLTRALNDDLQGIESTVFFTYQTINALTDYLISEYQTKLLAITGLDIKESPAAVVDIAPTNSAFFAADSVLDSTRANSTSDVGIQDIAIIGLSGRYAQSDSVEEFWEHLLNGRSCIEEIPEQRWNWSDYFCEEKGVAGATYSKWGGFVRDVEYFDSVFFGIAPLEAKNLDPQERLVLEEAYNCIAEAGYTPATVSSNNNVGIYIGVSNATYTTGAHFASIANRIAYTFNFFGPSMAIDSACSSSLTAIHLALESLYLGTSDSAIAGGVNLILDPIHFISLSKMTMLSQGPQCKAFAADADGFVAGEGVGLVLLKRLSDAQQDNDHIHGVIKGSMINSGGKTNGYTVPNPVAQSMVIEQAMARAGVEPESVSYIEAHGTGTVLGDPIEIAGLSKPYQSDVAAKQHCAIGSVKSNIGHCESAAGIAGLTKILLQFKHQLIVPSLNAEAVNPEIDFLNSPFYLQKEATHWPSKDSQKRRAGLSSFGAGGSNAHLIVEEYIEPSTEISALTSPIAILLSARSASALKQKIQQLYTAIDRTQYQDSDLAAIAYTLQAGREVFAFRVAILCLTISELLDKLSRLAMGEHVFGCYSAQANNNSDHLSAIAEPDEIEQLIKTWVTKGYSEKLVKQWVQGMDFDLTLLSRYLTKAHCKRLSLPGYPFERRPHWLAKTYPTPKFNQDVVTQKPSRHIEQATINETPEIQEVVSKAVILPSGNTLPRGCDNTHIAELQAGVDPANAVLSDKGSMVCKSVAELVKELQESFANILLLNIDEVAIDKPFNEMGMDSITGVEWVRIINSVFGLKLPTTKLYDYSSITELAKYIDTQLSQNLLSDISLDIASPLETLVHASSAEQHTRLTNGLQFESQHALKSWLIQSFSALLLLEKEDVDPERSFQEMGLDSITGVEWVKEINRHLNLQIATTRLYDFPNISLLTDMIAQQIEPFSAELVQERPPTTIADMTPETAKKQVKLNAFQIHKQTLDVVNEDTISSKKLVSLAPLTQSVPQLKHKVATPAQYGLVVDGVLSLDSIGLRSWQVSAPAGDEVQVQVYASALNFPDTMCINGLYPTIPSYPFVPGFEVSGVVTSVGSLVTRFKPGDEVVGLTGAQLGGHAEKVNMPEDGLVRKPVNLSFEQACSLPIIFSTIYHAFEVGNLGHGEQVLIQTASGGCGLMALQFAHLQGCEVYGTSSSAQKRNFLSEVGVEHVLDYRGEFDEQVMTLSNGRGVDVVLNMVSGDAMQRGVNSLGCTGRYLEIAIHALKSSNKFDLSGLLQNQSFHSIDLRRLAFNGKLSITPILEKMVEMVESGEIVPVVSMVYPVNQIQDALQYLAEGKHVGKVVLSHRNNEVEDLTDHCVNALRAHKRRFSFSGVTKPQAEVAFASAKTAVKEVSNLRKDIAIIGMAGQFPGASDIETYWQNIASGRDCVVEVPSWRWSIDALYQDTPCEGKSISKWMGLLDDADKFDCYFFGISPKEAELMDPQQRLFLEACWACIENAGINVGNISGSRTSVYVGCGTGDYRGQIGDDRHSAQGLVGASTSILSARISYYLNLQGPSVAIDTACSSSLVAIAEACNGLLLNNFDLAIAGGVNVLSGPSMHLMTSSAGMLSPHGRCFSFDSRANGFAPGEGVGALLLKRLSDAQQDNDTIHAVLKGWGTNQDGRSNGIMAPSSVSQVRLQKSVYDQFGIDPQTIGLVEAHGTGTQLGDPIEVAALKESFAEYTNEQHYCALGSVKSNIGHLLTAAGISAVVKVVMALKHKQLPPTINFHTLNENIDLSNSPFFISNTLQPWQIEKGKRRLACVSSFGFSGTNAHLVLQEYPEHEVVSPDTGPVLFVLSAKRAAGLVAYA
ncbi:SDR family NAD(P)-dependent oxidoreductase, partial [Pseudoalteromonas holothuriae]|uniref:SDR family NAD(P)-dependent oxidoreductase n=1 Tax=Pseudoalteromonas holothuriae TaxID=2963714 RepID=UPI0021BE24E5